MKKCKFVIDRDKKFKKTKFHLDENVGFKFSPKIKNGHGSIKTITILHSGIDPSQIHYFHSTKHEIPCHQTNPTCHSPSFQQYP